MTLAQKQVFTWRKQVFSVAGRWWQEAILHLLLSLPVSEKMEAGTPALLGPVRDFP